jgi:hypothetical protein
MGYSEYSDFIKRFGAPRTGVEGGEIALKKNDAVKAIELLKGSDVAVLGGDVYELENDGYFRPTYDNWYCNKCDYPSSVFAEKSQEKAMAFLKNYNETNLNVRYVLVVDADWKKSTWS